MEQTISEAAKLIGAAETVVVGAGAGLSAAAGYTYSGSRYQRLFPDFIERYRIPDMYVGGFWDFETPEESWAWWSRNILYNRYEPIPKPTYENLLRLLRDKDIFVITTNVDHCFQRAGFSKDRLFYTQGDFGLWQCSEPCHNETYDNEAAVRRMAAEQRDCRIPSELLPVCPKCGKPMSMNLRCDDTFVEDAGWRAAEKRYEAFLHANRDRKTVFLELGVGYNTPVWIKFPFRRMTRDWPDAVYISINTENRGVIPLLEGKSVCLNMELDAAITQLLDLREADGIE